MNSRRSPHRPPPEQCNQSVKHEPASIVPAHAPLTERPNALEHTGNGWDAGVAFLTRGGGPTSKVANGPYAFAVKRWQSMDGVARGAALVSAGSITLVV